MTCYNPLTAWRKARLDPNTGKRGITFNRSQGLIDMELSIPCGKCMGCRIRKSIDWALRCVHESLLYQDNCFITLTYDEDHLPEDGSLNKKHFQDFMKRLRKHAQHRIRYYMCGEYGSELQRPHYHAIIFNHDFADKKPHKYTAKSVLYTSESLSKLWPFGFSTVGAVNYTTAAYCARYTTKKIFGPNSGLHYGNKQPEFSQMSLRPGIGYGYCVKYENELRAKDSIVLNGREYPLPKYYEMVFEDLDKQKAIRKNKIDKANSTIERLRVREKVSESKRKIYERARDFR